MSDPVPLVAMRFARLIDGTHLDLASGRRVLVRVASVEERARTALAEHGAALAGLWHQDLAPYLDFGPLGPSDWFEASGVECDGANPAAERAAAFLWKHGLQSARLIDCPGNRARAASVLGEDGWSVGVACALAPDRSEERRVGKECRL